MPIPFLSVYRTLQAFVEKNPGFETLHRNAVDIVYYYPTFEEKLEQLGVKLGNPKAKDSLAELLLKHTRADIFEGIMTLLGAGKGGNSALLHRGTYVAKYDPQKIGQRDLMANNAALARMDRCVDLARDIARRAADAFDNNSAELLDSILLHHFQLKSADALRATVALNFRKIDQGLSGIFRLAANRHEPGRNAVGYVRFKKVPDDAEPSPNKTAGAPASIKDVTHGGSIHMDYEVFRPSSAWTDFGIATVIVHEASHKFCLTDDHAYHHEDDKYDQLSATLRVDNADSYALAAASIRAGQLITHRKTSELKL